MPILFIIFIIVPMIEIALFIQAGSWLGLAPTLLLIVLTAVIGITLLRQQGLSTLFKAQQKMNNGELPAFEMMEGILLAIAGALLITPGFFTDTVGFLLLIPAFRTHLFTSYLKNKMQVHMSKSQSGFTSSSFTQSSDNSQHNTPSNKQHRIIDGEYDKSDD